MKVIAIMGSPHKGNGYKIVKQIETELKKIGDIDFKYIFLSESNLQMCKGCFACISKGEQYCPLKDDRQAIEQEILQSDGVIITSPSYAWNVSGLMKNFIDRLAYNLHRPKFFKQSVMLVANGGSGITQTIDALSFAIAGGDIVCKLGIVGTQWEAAEKYAEKVNKDIEKNAKKFYESLNNKKPISPGIGMLVWFKIFKKIANASKQTLPADFLYYSDKKNYFYEVEVNPIKNMISELLANISMKDMRKKIVFK